MWNGITLWILLAFVLPLFTQSKFDPTPLPEPLLWGEPAHGACLDLLGTQAFFRCQATLQAMSSPRNPWFYEQHICPLQVNARHQIPIFSQTAWIRASCQMSESLTSLSLDLSHMDPDVSLEVEEGWQQPSFQGSASEGTWGPAGSTAPQGTALWVLFPTGLSLCHLELRWKTWMNFPHALSPREFILVRSDPCMKSPVWAHRDFQGIFSVNLMYLWYVVA